MDETLRKELKVERKEEPRDRMWENHIKSTPRDRW
jgi:hypothetical protein